MNDPKMVILRNVRWPAGTKKNGGKDWGGEEVGGERRKGVVEKVFHLAIHLLGKVDDV